MGEGEKRRLIAWNRELSAAHRRLRDRLDAARKSLDGDQESLASDLLLHCKGFCAALSGHHGSEDAGLFPELSARHPELRPTIAKLEQDHGMIGHLLERFDQALRSSASTAELSMHLDGLAAIMDSHFQYEERQLHGILATLDLDAEPSSMLGPP